MNNLTSLLLKYPDADWNWSLVSRNPCISWKFVQSHPDLPWNYYWMSLNPCVTLAIVADHPMLPFDRVLLARNPNFAKQAMELAPDFPSMVSLNPGITWNFVGDNLNFPWDFTALATHLPWEICKNNSCLLGSATALSANPNITWEIVQAYPEINWVASVLSSNPGITWNDIAAHTPNYPNNMSPWDTSALLHNPNTSWEVTGKLAVFRDNWRGRSANPNITLKEIEDNIDRVSWCALSGNNFLQKIAQ